MFAQIDKEYLKIRPWKIWSRLVSYALFEGRPVTTRGQWINPLIFFMFRIWTSLPLRRNVEKPIFIIGSGRSGTTLTGILLSMHRDVSFLNEPKALWHEIYDKEDVIGSYQTGEAYYELTEDNLKEDSIRKAQRLYSANLILTGSKRVVDKYPELIFRIPFVKQLFPDAKFLFIIRNGYDTLQSIEQWSDRMGEKKDGDVHDWWGVNDRKWILMCEQLVPVSNYLGEIQEQISRFENHKDRATVEWILTMEFGLKVREGFRESIFLLKYEDLIKNHTNVIKEILQFTDLPIDEKLNEYADKVIKKRNDKKKVSIHHLLEKPFVSLMKQYNYTV